MAVNLQELITDFEEQLEMKIPSHFLDACNTIIDSIGSLLRCVSLSFMGTLDPEKIYWVEDDEHSEDRFTRYFIDIAAYSSRANHSPGFMKHLLNTLSTTHLSVIRNNLNKLQKTGTFLTNISKQCSDMDLDTRNTFFSPTYFTSRYCSCPVIQKFVKCWISRLTQGSGVVFRHSMNVQMIANSSLNIDIILIYDYWYRGFPETFRS